jgi:hypothetical protein
MSILRRIFLFINFYRREIKELAVCVFPSHKMYIKNIYIVGNPATWIACREV